MKPPCSLLLLDLDGTVYTDGKALPGVIDCLEHLRAAGVPLLFLSNTTTKSAAVIHRALGEMGLALPRESIRTATLAARDTLLEKGLRRVRALLRTEAHADLAPLELVEADAEVEERPEAVLVGDMGAAWNYRMLDLAFRDLMAGSRLVACQRNRYFQQEGGLKLDAGPFVRLLEDAADQQALLVGKPASAFFLAAARGALGKETRRALSAGEVYMVGDDLENDVLGAQACGIRGVQVRTGKFRPADEDRAQREAHLVLDSLTDLKRHFT